MGFFVDLIFTVFIYLLVPAILALNGNKYELRKIKRIAIINGFVCWFIIQIIIVALGGEVSSGAAGILWSIVGYHIMKKKCLQTEDNIQEQISDASDDQDLHDSNYVSESAKSNGTYESDIALQTDEDYSHRADHPEDKVPDDDIMVKSDEDLDDVPPINLDCEASPSIEDINKTTTLSRQNNLGHTALFVLSSLLIIASVVSIILGTWVYTLENQISSLEEEIATLNKDINLLRTLEKDYCVGPDGEIINKHLAKVVDNYAWHTKVLSAKDSEGILTRKDIVATYINNLNMDYEEKIILFKSQYPSDDTYNEEIIEYLNNRSDISYDEMVSILKELGFTVEPDGTILW